MSRPARWPRLLALPLALWSTVPGVEWCRVGWADVRIECLAACSIDRSECPPAACERAAAKASCSTGPAGCSADAEPFSDGCPSAHPGTQADTEEYPGGRAFCLAGPSGGDGVPATPPPVPDATPLAAVLPVAPLPDVRASRADRTSDLSRSPPPPAATWAAARSRAPPVESTTC